MSAQVSGLEAIAALFAKCTMPGSIPSFSPVQSPRKIVLPVPRLSSNCRIQNIPTTQNA